MVKSWGVNLAGLICATFIWLPLASAEAEERSAMVHTENSLGNAIIFSSVSTWSGFASRDSNFTGNQLIRESRAYDVAISYVSDNLVRRMAVPNWTISPTLHSTNARPEIYGWLTEAIEGWETIENQGQVEREQVIERLQFERQWTFDRDRRDRSMRMEAPVSVPEPGSFALITIGAAMLLLIRGLR